MILREIDLGVLTPNETSKEINANGQCITHLLMLELGKIKNFPVKKLCVDLVERLDEIGVEVTADNIGCVTVDFDFVGYFQLETVFDKKSALLKALFKAIRLAAEQLAFELEPFESAYQRILASAIATEFTWGKPKWNQAKSLQAQVFYNFNMQHIELGLVVTDKSGCIVVEKVLLKQHPHFMFIEPYLGRLSWIDNDRAVLISKDKHEVFSVSPKV